MMAFIAKNQLPSILHKMSVCAKFLKKLRQLV